jgi:predicted ribosome quality control (RQC) complex YloA/Tae2 family protein
MPNLHLWQLHKVIGEISAPLRGGYLRHITQPDKATIVLEIRAQQQNFQLLFCLAKGFTRCHLIFRHVANPPTPLAFCQFLRKYGEGAHITQLEVASDDRVVSMSLLRYVPPPQPAVGDGVAALALPQVVHYRLIAELWGSHSNLLWLDESGKIMASLYHHATNERPALPGCVYQKASASSIPPLPAEQDFLLPHYNPALPFAWNQATTAFYGQSCEEAKESDEYQRFVRWLTREISLHEKLLQKFWQQFAASEQGEEFRIWGELLKPMASRLARGTAEVEAINYFAADTPAIMIPLNTKLTGRENMEKYFKKYQKFARGHQILEAELTRIETETGLLHRLLEEAQRTPPAQIASVWDKLPNRLGGRWKRRETAQPSKTKTEPRQPFHRFCSYDGCEILVGKSARDNEDLTFRFARGNDWWLHAADYPGSHVVVRCGSKPTLPQETLLDAAHLAAHYSKAREHTKANIVYTRRKCVSKSKHGKAGAVLVSQEKHCQVVMDEQRLKRLLDNKDGEAAGRI